jgi:hypothetical protein
MTSAGKRGSRRVCDRMRQWGKARLVGPGLPGQKKLKRLKLAINSFKKGQIVKKKIKGQIFNKKFVKIAKLKFRIS